jgi:hypothetical protein
MFVEKPPWGMLRRRSSLTLSRRFRKWLDARTACQTFGTPFEMRIGSGTWESRLS